MTKVRMLYESLIDNLLQRMPALTPGFTQQFSWWEGEKPGPHVVFGDLFVPYIVSLLKNRKKDDLTRAFGFLEEMASQGDTRVREVVVTTVLESLIQDQDLLKTAREQMGLHTRQLLDRLQRDLNPP